jgi:uncharacterized membrane protein
VVLNASPDMSIAKRVEVWIWVLIYIGMAVIALGLSMSRSSRSVGFTMACFGAGFTVVGIVLIYVRSTMKDSGPKRVNPKESEIK